MKCPRCQSECERPTVDCGVGEIAVGPWACDACYWVEGITSEEQATLDAALRESAPRSPEPAEGKGKP